MKFLQLALSTLLVAVVSSQQSHPQLQAYLAQQQQLQQQQQILQQQPARQQYRLLQQPQVQQQYSSDDDNSAAQYQQLPQLSPQLYRAQAVQAQAQPQQQQLSPAAIARLRAVQAAQQGQAGGAQLENPEDYDPNPQYQFGFDVKDDQFTNYQNRKEQRDGDKISGSYSVVDSDGFIRTVTYTADPKEGFKAEVTRTPTDIVVKLPTPPPQQLTEAAGLQRQLAARQQQYEQPSAQPVQYSSRPTYSVAPQHAAASSPQQLQQLLAAQQRPLLRAASAAPSAAYQTYQQQ